MSSSRSNACRTAKGSPCRPIRPNTPRASISLAAVAEASPLTLAPGARVLVPTGLAIALPAGFEGQVRPRSGLALKHGITVLNAPGTIDADYRGEVGVVLINHGSEPFVIRRGERIAQLVIAPGATGPARPSRFRVGRNFARDRRLRLDRTLILLGASAA